MLVPLAILVATYALLTLRRLPWWRWKTGHRPWVALAGGAAMIATGALALPRAVEALNVDILLLLFGMLALAAALEVCGFFDWLARRVVERAATQRQLLVATALAGAVLSALFLNDAVVLIFTPVLVRACARMRCDPMPYLAALAISANVGSVATPVGNPQNAYIAIASGMPFPDFVLGLLPLAALSLAAAIGVLLAVFRRALAAPLHRDDLYFERHRTIAHPQLFRATVAVLGLVFAGFVLGHLLGVSLAHVALGGGLAVLLAGAVLARPELTRLVRGIDATILVFFVGLFWVIAGFRDAGLSDQLAGAFLGGAAPSLVPLTALTAVLSNIVSNVPAVLLLAPTVEAVGSPSLWLALAASSTLAGNATLVGAAANVIVAETARANGAEFSVRRFMAAGVPITLVTLGLTVLLLR